MNVRKISIIRENDWGHDPINWANPMIATIMVEDPSGKVELVLSEDLSRRIMEVIADEVAGAGKATVEAMVANIFTQPALSAPVKMDMPF